MSYRTHIWNGKEAFQIFGNGEHYKPLLNFVRSEGGKVDNDGRYSHEIKDINKFIKVLEKFIGDKDKQMKKYKVDIYNLRKDELSDMQSLTFRALNLVENAHIFVSASVVNFLGDALIRELNDFSEKKIDYVFTIREGHKIFIEGG